MKKKISIKNLLPRYLILLIVAFLGLEIFYFVFSPLTVYPVFLILGLFFKTTLLSESTILIPGNEIELIGACIAGSAYSLLLILNLATPDIKIKQRLQLLGYSFVAILSLNILRIFLLSVLATKSIFYFNLVHMFFWYVLSIVFVVAIWIYLTKKFKIKKIPFYSDIKSLHKLTKRK